MDVEAQIDEARRRFARSLVGRWTTAQGTFDAVMAQHWEIRADGTGQFTDTGPFGYIKAQTKFEWRQTEPFVFELRETEVVIDQQDSTNEPDDDDDSDCAWVPIKYDFATFTTDCGTHVGLIAITRTGSNGDGFYLSLAPLQYDGPIT
jgi:hypothetical protein